MYLVFDIGASKTRFAVSDGKELKNIKIIETPQEFNQAVKIIQETIRDICKGKKIEASAGGVAGVLDESKDMLTNSHLIDWINQPLKEILQKITQAPVFLENDSAIVGLGEAIFGAGKGFSIVGYITVSTGIGGARIVNGKIDVNAHGFEPGYQIIRYQADKDFASSVTYLDHFISGFYLEKRFGKKAESITDPDVWDEVEKYLAIGLNNTIVHWSPDVMILGGSVMKSINFEKLKDYLTSINTVFNNPPQIKKATLGDQGGLYGALAYLNQKNT